MLENLAARVNADSNLAAPRQTRQHELPDRDRCRGPHRARRARTHRVGHARPVHHAELCVRVARLARGLGEALVADTDPRLHRHLRAGEEELLRIEGDLHPFMSNLLYFKGVLAAPVGRAGGRMSPRFEPAIGRYLHLDLLGRPHRLYVEEAGVGHSAPMLAHRRLRRPAVSRPAQRCAHHKNFRVIVFDMPWHGKSSPPVGWENEEYRLTSRDYVRMILEVVDALELDKPVVMGCSIGGRIVLHLAHEHPENSAPLSGSKLARTSIPTTT